MTFGLILVHTNTHTHTHTFKSTSKGYYTNFHEAML